MAEEEGLSREEVVKRLKEKFPSEFKSLEIEKNVIVGRMDGKHIFPICRFLALECGFDHISCISAVDKEKNYEVVYHISSYPHKMMIQLNAEVSKEEPKIRTVTGIWYGANYHEREAYDMMGIIFEEHPNLARILLPDDFEGYPLRKDYKLKYREGEGSE
jgi:NADH-quinone oxidoreductase subunit C